FSKRTARASQTLNVHGAGRLVLRRRDIFLQQLVERIVAAKAFELDLDAEVVRAVGVDKRLLEADFAFFVKHEQSVVEGLAAFLNALLHSLFDDVHLASFNQLLDARRVHKDLDRGDALAVDAGNQTLRDDAAEIERELHQNLRVARLGKEVEDALERLVGVGR